MSARPPPRSGLARGVRLGRAAIVAGGHEALERLGVASGADGRGARAGRALMAELLELRGAALKIAQFLSLESDLLPEAFAHELAGASHRVRPMGPSFARDRIRASLGPVERCLGTFKPVPFAAASIGQVHAATTRRGEPLAVKVQYPGMPESIRSDILLLRRATSLLPHGAHYRRLLEEIEDRLLEECDYEREAENVAWFAARLRVDGVTVPTLHRGLCGPTVVTTTRVPGLHLEDWLRTGPTQHARDAAAQRLHDVFMQSMHVLGRLHADPNPGNFLFGDAGEVGLVDFGCTREIGPDYQDIVVRIWRAALARDDEAAHQVYRDIGLFAHLDNDAARALDSAAMKPFVEWLSIPMRVDRFDFGADAAFVAEGRRRFGAMLRQHALVGIRPEFVLVNRTLYGLYRIFERLGARVRCRADS